MFDKTQIKGFHIAVARTYRRNNKADSHTGSWRSAGHCRRPAQLTLVFFHHRDFATDGEERTAAALRGSVVRQARRGEADPQTALGGDPHIVRFAHR
jgi:hypothetical protein